MSKDKRTTSLAAAALLLSALLLSGCATSTAGSSLIDARAQATALPKTSVYLPVEDMPKRDKPAMTADERSKIQKELIAVRDRQTSGVKTRGRAAPPKPPVPWAPVDRPQ